MIDLKELASIVSLISPDVESAPEHRIRLNVGMMMDIPTGDYIRNPDGRWVLNGGLQVTTGVAGLPNTFKTTLLLTITAIAANRLIMNHVPTQITTYDTEVTLNRSRLEALIDRLPALREVDPFKSGVWVLTSKVEQNGTDWWSKIRKALNLKVKNAKSLMVETPIIGRDGKALKIIVPTFLHLDSLTAFAASDVEEMEEKLELADPKGRMIYRNSGLSKARLLTSLSSIAERANGYFSISAHVGESQADMSAGPYSPPPDKKLPTMKTTQRYKGVTDNFFSLLHGIWQTQSVKKLIADRGSKDKQPLYPKDKHDNGRKDIDLQLVTIQLMRSKSSADGGIIELVLSKAEGFLPELSEFHLLKSNDDFGLAGNDQSYHCVFYPEVKMRRTTVRGLLTDPRLARAINICSELFQIYQYKKLPNEEWRLAPEELYEKLKTLGYDWELILSARGWHSLGHPPKTTLTVTTMDLLAIAAGELDLPEFKNKD